MITYRQAQKLFRYDARTGSIWWRFSGTGRRLDKPAGSRSQGYILIEHRGKGYGAHRIVWLLETKHWPKHQLDHRNGVRSDNRFCNLRRARQKDNSANAKLRADSKTNLKGVHKRAKRWFAAIRRNYKLYHLGSFATPELAHAAYVAAAKKHFGEFARAA